MTGKRMGMLLGVAAACSCVLGGCGKEEVQEEYVPRPVAAPPVAAPPPLKSVAELKAELRIDERVHLPENRAPASTEGRKAVLEFFDAFARGEHSALAPMLSEQDRKELEAMVASGDWQRATADITSVEIQTGPSLYGDAALALFEVGGMDYQPQMWYYRRQGERYEFEAAPSPPDMMNRLSGVDWIASWHQVLEQEEEIAVRPDTPVHMPQRRIEEDVDRGGTPPSGPGFPG